MGNVSHTLSVLGELNRFDEFLGIGPPSIAQPSAGLKSKLNNFIQGDHAQKAFHSAPSKVLKTVHDNHKQILGAAVNTALYHVGGLDYPSEVHNAIHHEVVNLGNNLSVASGMAHQMMTHPVGKLRGARGASPAVQESSGDEEIDALLVKLHKVLKDIEPHYRNKR